MAKKGRKPIPKTQRELSVSQQVPLNENGPGFQSVGNPNNSTQLNRGEQVSFNGDTYKPFSVGIQDIDEAVYYYFTNVIRPFVIQNGTRIEVPVIYGSPEKWASFQKFGYFRDSQGKIMMPIIMFKRDNIEKVRTVANKLDANYPNNTAIHRQSYSSKNAYDNFSVLNNVRPEKVNYAIVVPDYLTLTYSCAINTYYMEQLNKIVEAIEYASDSYWGDPSRFQFRAMIDSFAIKTELSDNAERTVSSTFNIKLNGYIIPDTIQKDATALKKIPDVTRIIITEQIMGDGGAGRVYPATYGSFNDSFDDSFG
tara:strand:- start:805 stop:1734 length:930 start_codon:yes stop_codon:yes gene_type:complete